MMQPWEYGTQKPEKAFMLCEVILTSIYSVFAVYMNHKLI